MEIEYERWNCAADLLNIIDNRDGRYDNFFRDTEVKCHMLLKTGANGIMEIRNPPEGSDCSYHVIAHSGEGVCEPHMVCGNGCICAVAFACEYRIVPQEKWASFTFLTGDGEHTASFIQDTEGERHDVTISMADIRAVKSVDGNENEWFANSGIAHLVNFVERGTLQFVDIERETTKLLEEKKYLGAGAFFLVSLVEEHYDGVHARIYDPGLRVEVMSCGSASMSIAVTHAVRSGEPNQKQRKEVHWSNTKVLVGYTKKGNDFYDNSLRSVVFKKVKDKFIPDELY